MGITVTGISMITVPATVGVRIRRNSERRLARANWNGDNDQCGQHGGPAFRDRRDANRDKGPRGPHQEDIAGAEPANPDGLQNCANPTDHDRGKYHPQHVDLGAACRLDHDDRRDDNSRYRENG